ncbi:CENP-S associating centromere protein X-domain-containing protein [Lophiotrema nucula]|uniref:CENP-S associating centromere protein X-domain-containing protein n=1 Tax=Lophiotrema nucula TaxID=690887 RepID=A0A6A5ZNW0_9PLEO|nr:CENP-S associating centromere protein X-domain-containing protein [Lophiotrema nucula]
MPAAATATTARRKGPAFKPPRPVNGTTQPSKPTVPAKRASATGPSAAAKKPTTAKPTHKPIPTIINSSESEQEDTFSEIDFDDLEDASADEDRMTVTETQREAIPPKLLARLLYEGFEDGNMQIQKGALDLTGKYIEIFVKEAIARARFERRDARKGSTIADGFLQVEDLEKLTPGLVLDF